MKIVLPGSAGPGAQQEVAPAHLEFEARESIVLRCGEASIELRRDGAIVIRGGYIETEAEGIQRIKGAQVRIN